MDHVEVGDAAEVAEIAGADGESEFQGASRDREVGDWEVYTLWGLLAANARHDLGSYHRDRMYRNCRFELVKEVTAVRPHLRRRCAVDTVADLRRRSRRTK